RCADRALDCSLRILLSGLRCPTGFSKSAIRNQIMLLTPYRVLDLTGPLGFLTGKIFGDIGADVIKVEPAGGDPARRQRPFLNNGNGCRESLYWLAYNTNKRGVTLNLENDKGRDLFYRLASESDF